jgi:hypothetical protein
MDLSVPAAGMQTASAAFDSAAQSIAQAFNGGRPTQLGNAANQGDSADLSMAVAGLLKSKLDFMANVQLAVVEDSLTTNSLSVLG